MSDLLVGAGDGAWLGDLLVGLLAGLPLGAAWFGGLYVTIRRGVGARRPAVVFAGSLLLRLALLALALWWVGRGAPARLLGIVGGVLVVRTLAIRLARRRLVGVGTGAAPATAEDACR